MISVSCLDDFGIRARGKTKGELLMDLNTRLLEAASLDRDVVVVLDEAQNLTHSAMEEIRDLHDPTPWTAGRGCLYRPPASGREWPAAGGAIHGSGAGVRREALRLNTSGYQHHL